MQQHKMHQRFRSFLPVVIDVETGGLDHKTDALLEVAVVFLSMDEQGHLSPSHTRHWHVEPFEGSIIRPESLAVNGICLEHPFRIAYKEDRVLGELFKAIREQVKQQLCTRSILVGHNAIFDLNFINTASERCGIKRNPFHPFSTLDTVSLGALAYGQTVLSRIAQAMKIPWSNTEAHSALYDAEQTARIFCGIMNQWPLKGAPRVT